MAMEFDGTPVRYPTRFTIPKSVRSNAYVQTYSSVAHFSWGFFIIGKEIQIGWDYLPSEDFDDLDLVFQQDEEIVWDPDVPGLGKTFNVQILNFTGDYFESVLTEAEVWRQNCQMTLLIMGENTESS